MSTIDLDQELRPRKQQRVEGISGKIHTDEANLMDNWLTSSRETGKQRTSADPRDQQAWKARRALHPMPKDQTKWWWHYSEDGKQRTWAPGRLDSTMSSLTRDTSELSLSQKRLCTFPSEFGNPKVSWVYRNYWIGGDTQGFMNTTIFQEWNGTGADYMEYICMLNFRAGSGGMYSYFSDAAKRVADPIFQENYGPEIPDFLIESPNTIWQVGKCMLHILTRGRFWNEVSNALSPTDNCEKFGPFKKNKLQAKYSRGLLKHVLGCLSFVEYQRFTREHLMNHFRRVFSVYSGTDVPEPEKDTLDGPYRPKTSLKIPEGLTQAEGQFYEGLVQVLKIRQARTSRDGIDRTPHIVTITDLAKDYDDLMALMCLKELHRMDIVQLEGFVANLMPAKRRALFGRGALDSLGLSKIPIGIGSVGDPLRELDNYSHEFDNTERFVAPDKTSLEEGQKLLRDIFEKETLEKKKLTVLTISSLMDVANFSQEEPDLLRHGVSNVILQGGYRLVDKKLVPDPAAANNCFDIKGAELFHEFMQRNNISSTAWTKVAANATPIFSSLFEFLHNTGHPLGLYLRSVQMSQEVAFYDRCCSGRPFAPHMTQEWAVKNKTTWFAAGHEPDEPVPLGEAMLPYFTKVIGYDALAVVGASGEDILRCFDIIRPLKKRQDADHPLHHLVGIPSVDGLPEEANLDGEKMGVAISALMKGSILAFQQGL
ncbi:inosine/uridine-preferring nucleoside hydrolase [Diplocarpon rosae]|nr:inosine/uridine-preferring nucleoside hydrolase [Diplocarpon rosae]